MCQQIKGAAQLGKIGENKMTTNETSIIEISGWDNKNHMCLWNGNGVDTTTDFSIEDYGYTPEDAKIEVVKAQEWLNEQGAKLDWVNIPTAYISDYSELA